MTLLMALSSKSGWFLSTNSLEHNSPSFNMYRIFLKVVSCRKPRNPCLINVSSILFSLRLLMLSTSAFVRFLRLMSDVASLMVLDGPVSISILLFLLFDWICCMYKRWTDFIIFFDFIIIIINMAFIMRYFSYFIFIWIYISK